MLMARLLEAELEAVVVAVAAGQLACLKGEADPSLERAARNDLRVDGRFASAAREREGLDQIGLVDVDPRDHRGARRHSRARRLRCERRHRCAAHEALGAGARHGAGHGGRVLDLLRANVLFAGRAQLPVRPRQRGLNRCVRSAASTAVTGSLGRRGGRSGRRAREHPSIGTEGAVGGGAEGLRADDVDGPRRERRGDALGRRR